MKLKDFFNVGEIVGYFFRKKDPNNPPNFNTRMMHGVNRLAIIMFLFGVVYLLYKLLLKK